MRFLQRLLCIGVACFPATTLLAAEPEHPVVEKVTPLFALDRSGLRVGDTVRGWVLIEKAGGARQSGVIRSPFDFALVETEQSQRGDLTLEVLRGAERLELVVPPSQWWGETRAAMGGSMLERYQRSVARFDAKEFDLATTNFEQLASEAQGQGRAVLAAWLLHKTATTLRKADRFEPAARLTRRAVQIADAAHEPRIAAWLLQAAGHELWQRGRLGDARPYIEDALARRMALDPKSLAVAQSLQSMSILTSSVSEFDAARIVAGRMLALARERAPGSLVEAEAYHQFGNITFWSDDQEAAIDYFRRALAIRENVDPGGITEGRSLATMGNVYWRREELAIAQEYVERAARIYFRLDPQGSLYGQALMTLGYIAHDRRDLVTAEQYQLRALDLFQKIAPGAEQLPVLEMALGNIARVRGDLDTAQYYLERSLAAFQKLKPGTERVSLAMHNIGIVEQERGNLDAAAKLYEQSLAIVRSFDTRGLLLGSRLSVLGDLNLERGRLDEAEALFREALGLFERACPGGLRIAQTELDLGNLERRRGRVPQAREHFMRAAALGAEVAPGTLYEAEPLAALASLARDSGDTNEALELYERAIDALEAQRTTLGGSDEVQAGFSDRHAPLYWDYLDLLVASRKTAAAFDVSERYRARALLAQIAARGDRLGRHLPPDLERRRNEANAAYDRAFAEVRKLAERNASKEKLQAAAMRLQQARRQRELLNEQVRNAHPRLGTVEFPRVATPFAVRSALGADTLLLSYVMTRNAAYVFAVGARDTSADGVTVHRLAAGPAQIDGAVERWRVLIAAHGTGADARRSLDAAGVKVADLLFEPVKVQLAAAKRLIVIADGDLHRVPWAALREPAERAGAQSRYLIERLPVFATMSATAFTLEAGRRPMRRVTPAVEMVALGDPRYGAPDPGRLRSSGEILLRGHELAPLPWTATEVTGIGHLFGRSAQVWTGDDATEGRAKSVPGDLRYLHIAAHAVLDERSPLDSFLALSQTPSATGADNGLLQGWEVVNEVDLEADLVTLSACDTALGREAAGEGLIGLTRAFQLAGARAVLASLWAVSDESTSVLMKDFYRRVRDGESLDAALRSAQLALLRGSHSSWRRWLGSDEDAERLRHPFFWAAFQLNGVVDLPRSKSTASPEREREAPQRDPMTDHRRYFAMRASASFRIATNSSSVLS